MHYSYIVVASGLLATVSGHGLVTSIQGANGVTMPGLSVADGTPRDCSSNGCGSQADTSIIRDRELGTSKASALGRTEGNGPVDASVMVGNFMNGTAAPTNKGAASSSGVEDDLSALKGANKNQNKRGNFWTRGLVGDFLTGLAGGGGGNKGTKSNQAAETNVAASAGQGASEGLPTCSDDGSITMTFRQINQDGAGPLTADVDGTSGGTDVNAFQKADVTQDVPGLPIGGLSLATNTDFPVTVQMPAGMTCDATVGGVDNVCVVRVRNGALAGPFGGSAAFTMSPAAKKRAVEYRLKKRAEEAKYQNRRLR
ncbi:cell surface protein [Xylariaceae sp. AK1471]|nr:cell surface protein [Xylariaceae sp. AK1471]